MTVVTVCLITATTDLTLKHDYRSNFLICLLHKTHEKFTKNDLLTSLRTTCMISCWDRCWLLLHRGIARSDWRTSDMEYVRTESTRWRIVQYAVAAAHQSRQFVFRQFLGLSFNDNLPVSRFEISKASHGSPGSKISI